MKVGINAENVFEKSVLTLGQVPQPVVETQASMILARVILVATKLGIFESLSSGKLEISEIAERCKLHRDSLQQLLNALVSIGYLLQEGKYYKLAAVARKWLLKESEYSLYELVILREVFWEWLLGLEHFVCTGQSLEIHEQMSSEQWQLYQRAMKSIAKIAAPELLKYTPIPTNAKKMLDIGGSHGYFSVTLCRQYPNLHAVILDLPKAIEYAAPLLAEEEMGDRIIYKAGNALTEDLGVETYDLIFMSNFNHHLDQSSNIELFKRAARALRPGGYLVVQKVMFPTKDSGQLGVFADLFFALTSAAGNWSFSEIAEWQRQVGLVPNKTIYFRQTPSTGQQVAMKI